MNGIGTNQQTALQVMHRTSYDYAEPVALSLHQAMLKPRALPTQAVANSYINVEPTPRSLDFRVDYHGNLVSDFELDSPHRELVVTATSEVYLTRTVPPDFTASSPMEQIAGRLAAPQDDEDFIASEFLAASPYAPRSERLASYARELFWPGRPYLSGVHELMQTIHAEFRYDKDVTTISTPVATVLSQKCGVCQDFAHLMIACLRSLGGPARYVSGYLVPRAGVVGDQASHAWVSAYCPELGWVDFDPTNNIVPTDGHITLAWGRDYSDVSPLRGVIFGGGEHTVQVAVRIIPLSAQAALPGSPTPR